jgi:hypothetical protein
MSSKGTNINQSSYPAEESFIALKDVKTDIDRLTDRINLNIAPSFHNGFDTSRVK